MLEQQAHLRINVLLRYDSVEECEYIDGAEGSGGIHFMNMTKEEYHEKDRHC